MTNIFKFIFLLFISYQLGIICAGELRKNQIKLLPNNLLIQEIKKTCGKYLKDSNKEYFIKTISNKISMISLSSKSAVENGKKILSNCIRINEFTENADWLLRKG